MRRKLLIVGLLSVSMLATQAQDRRKVTKPGNHTENTINWKEIGAPLPEDFKIYTNDSTYIRYDDVKGKSGNLLLMMFNPTCGHCEEQAILFKDNFSMFKNSRLIMLAAPNMLPYLEYFTNTTRMTNFKGIPIGVDSFNYIDRTYLYEMLPQINIYDRDRKLVKMFYGPTPLDSLKQYID